MSVLRKAILGNRPSFLLVPKANIARFSVFEWKTQVQLRIETMEEDIQSVRTVRAQHAPQTAAAASFSSRGSDSAVDEKSFQLMKEFEDHETAFQRHTTKLSIDAAREETERAVSKSNQV